MVSPYATHFRINMPFRSSKSPLQDASSLVRCSYIQLEIRESSSSRPSTLRSTPLKRATTLPMPYSTRVRHSTKLARTSLDLPQSDLLLASPVLLRPLYVCNIKPNHHVLHDLCRCDTNCHELILSNNNLCILN